MSTNRFFTQFASIFCLLLASVFVVQADAPSHEQREKEAIKPWSENAWYWSYKGEPALLLGGSDEDNLFNNLDMMKDNFEKMKACGANYIRSTLSVRDEGNVYPFEKTNGLFDLDKFNPEYWRRLEASIDQAYQQDAFVQIELWATFDHYREYWLKHPFNPANNKNISADATAMKPEWDFHPAQKRNPFFFSFPEMNNETLLLKYQKAFVKKALDVALPYPNVLYCMDNETRAPAGWSLFWGRFVREYAKQKGVTVQVTEMYDNWDIRADEHKPTYMNPDVFSFMEVSQNNWQEGQTHYDRLLWMRNNLANTPGGVRPMSNVKVYHRLGGNRPNDPAVGIERWMRNVFAGCASTRFHRPDSGLGLAPEAQTLIRSMRTFLNDFDIFHSEPAPGVLSECDDNEAYCLAISGKAYALYFPKGGEVNLKLPEPVKSAFVRWLDPNAGQFLSPKSADIKDNAIRLQSPGMEAPWLVLVECR
ncbi:MAG: hypothetical protein P9L94_20040 [Candidatus Hinthialibacter antarcticus]|nr:hypothetical protein [Candidatus Hinthialibacter antarcticus]